ncbi:MAG: hypothetical protein ABFC94_07760, partial [Syntrophomonas sp.]
MQSQKDKIMSKEQFLKNGSYAKEEYEGLIVGSDDKQGLYNIGVQLGEDRILVVDRARDNNIHEKLQEWVPQI